MGSITRIGVWSGGYWPFYNEVWIRKGFRTSQPNKWRKSMADNTNQVRTGEDTFQLGVQYVDTAQESLLGTVGEVRGTTESIQGSWAGSGSRRFQDCRQQMGSGSD